MPPHRFQSSLRRACIVAAFLSAGGHILAQQDSGGILVTVQDASGAVVPNASANVVNNDTQANSEGKTNAIGIWNATPLPPGDYRVTVSHAGFETSVAEHVTVQIQQNTRVPITLKVGSTSQSLVVQAAASLLQTEDVSVGQTISGVLKDDLPVSDRDFNRLAVLTVGVNYSTPSGPRDTASGAFSANGISQYQNNYILDGTDNNSYDQNINEGRTFAIEPSLDAISEFSVLTNAYSAEFGRDGGAVVIVNTKSGTNHLHGSAYEYFQTSDFNSNDYFNNALAISKTDYHKNIFGASVGGPVVLPKLYNGHDKTFFFADYEGNRKTQSAPEELLVVRDAVVGNPFAGADEPIGEAPDDGSAASMRDIPPSSRISVFPGDELVSDSIRPPPSIAPPASAPDVDESPRTIRHMIVTDDED